LGKSSYKKVEKISVEEILKHERKLYLEDCKRIAAVNELGSFVREIGSKSAYKIKGFCVVVRGLSCPLISKNLSLYIRSVSQAVLKRDIESIIVELWGSSGYSEFKGHENWKRVKRGWFSWFYYHDVRDYVNVYTVLDSDLALHINHEFSKTDKEHYLNRLWGHNR